MPLAHLDPFARHPLVFLTVCTAKRSSVLSSPIAHSILANLWRNSYERNGWCVGNYVVMPDHIHLFAMPAEKPDPLSKWIATWKSMSAKQVIAKTGALAPIWQHDYFDRYLRTAEAYGDKWEYVRNNPIRAKLAKHPGEWPYQGVIHELRW